ncbi:hypothetical protein [Amycolatopsis sp. DG1A-15b]|uniref:hypothetical protein n=1 Tax=Amycolatopsis sp. DG1A-15b TaxID=3052846 RepID=UPI00255B84BB|nr:hypothetical protein [Amycolatopsis sp. DG1A-15b]WIX86940.1 hypothetical protein QRY02_38125 [Amycolatopsis sp. DG1A-15b]
MSTEAPPRPQRALSRLRPTPKAREGLLALLAGFVISGLFNYPVVLHPKSLVTGDLGDPLLQAWQLAWQHHFVTSGGALWTGNTLYPAPDSYAFSDSLLGYLPLGLFGDGPYAAIMRYNAVFLLSFALAFAGAYVLIRQLGGNWQAAALAGTAFAWAPWRLTHASHLNILSAGGIALALFAIARGHGYSLRHGRRPELSRPWWAFVGWAVAAWQVTLGFAVGMPFIYLLGVVGLVVLITAVRRWPRFGTRLAVADGAGVVVFLAVTYLMTIPYRRVVDEYGFTRAWKEVQLYSPPPQGLLAAPDSTWLWQKGPFNLWSGTFADPAWVSLPGASEKLLFPGLALLLVALAGLFFSVWSVRARVGLAVATVVVTVFALGSEFFGGDYTYYVLWRYLPGWDALRTPGRLMLWVLLLLAVLAAGALTRAAEWLRTRDTTYDQGRFLQALLVVPLLFALLEGVPDQPHPSPPGIPPDVAKAFEHDPKPALILPISQDVAPFSEFVYQFWSTDGFPPLANGHNGLLPPQYGEIITAATTFPDAHSVDVLRKYGIQQVLVLKVGAAGTPYEAALTRPLDGLPLTRSESADLVTFTLR